jgi:hypothetical protein
MIVLTTTSRDARRATIDITAAGGDAALTLLPKAGDTSCAVLTPLPARRGASPTSWRRSPSAIAPDRPDAHLRCRSGRHVWLDDTARERCCDPAWRKVLVQRHEWATPAASGVEYAGRSAVAGLDYGWQRVTDQAA